MTLDTYNVTNLDEVAVAFNGGNFPQLAFLNFRLTFGLRSRLPSIRILYLDDQICESSFSAQLHRRVSSIVRSPFINDSLLLQFFFTFLKIFFSTDS